MSVTPGSRLGSYDILSRLGAGGMGEVYRARDTRLGREVAIKLLPEPFASDPDRLARFEREAQVLATLNHPHIASIYGLEESGSTRALVLELVEGPTLAERLQGGPLALVEALPVARQIAEALEAAHERGVIHRDLKPANVKLTADGKVKVLDFGLATVAGGDAASGDAAHSPTITIAATRAGIILGTAAYMSPEQAAGKPVDKRADVWSFGVVLWEMLTGGRLFDGETVSHTLADVLRAPIDFNRLPDGTPSTIRELLRRCLDRDPTTRLRDIGEARLVLQRPVTDPRDTPAEAANTSSHARGRPALLLAWTAAAVAAAAALAVAVVHFREPVEEFAPVVFQIQAPASTSFASTGVLSPDGRLIAFPAPAADGRPVLWIRALDSLEARALPGTEGVAAAPFWSPDSRSLGFGTSGFPRRLKRIDVTGGLPQTLAEFSGFYREGAWSTGGDILYGESTTGLWRVRAAGGTPVQVTKLDSTRGEVQHAGPDFLPDGRRFLYYRAAAAPEHRGIFLGSLERAVDDQPAERLLAVDSDPKIVSSESGPIVLFLRDGSLLAQRFDGNAFLGDPIRLAEDVGNLGSYGFYSATSRLLAYRTGREASQRSTFVWFDRAGKRVAQMTPGDFSNGLQLSPDGKQIVTQRAEGTASSAVTTVTGGRLWVADVARGVFGRLLSQDASETSPAISADHRIAFSSTAGGAVGDLYIVTATGVGTPEPLLLKSATVKHPNDFSPDTRYLIFDDHTTTQRQDLFVLPLTPVSGRREPIPFVATGADETFGQFSPDGRWVAYATDESGRREVVVQGFAPDRVPAAAVGKWVISPAGGDKPRWSPDGRELYYIGPDRTLMAVPVKTGQTFEPGVAAPLFQLPVFTGFFPYDVAPNGRFLVNVVSNVEGVTSSPLTVVLNWQQELRR